MKPILAVCLAAAALFPAVARADGLPVQNVDVGGTGVSLGGARYVTIPAGRNTVVAKLDRNQVVASRTLRGSWTIPAVAYDGSAAGLSRSTLVLIAPRTTFPRADTRFTFLHPGSLAPQGVVRLAGDYSFDAISPDGRRMYLIHYTSAVDSLRYEVRSFDVGRARLDPGPVVDPRSPGEKMNGDPLTRAYGAGGRWAYTLYSGREHPFVHALDTTGRSARCIDLDLLAGRKDLRNLRLAAGAHSVSVKTHEGTTLAVIDTSHWETSVPGKATTLWRWVAVAVAALLAATLVRYVVSRRRAASTSFGGATSA
jgi:hypothetical protein